MELDRRAIGRRIQEQREKLGFTQQYIYDKIDISQNHYSRVENGHVGIAIEKLLQISDILNISIDYILKGTDSNNKKSEFETKYDTLSSKQQQFINQQIESLKKFDLK